MTAFTWYGGDLIEQLEASPRRCYLCATPLDWRDGRETCAATGTPVHPECHTDTCLSPACADLTCTPERCPDLAPSDWDATPTCPRHRPTTTGQVRVAAVA